MLARRLQVAACLLVTATATAACGARGPARGDNARLTTEDAAWRPVVLAQTPPTPGAPLAPCALEGKEQPVPGCPEDLIGPHAARLLGCPREKLVLRRVFVDGPSTHVLADGCGQRVVYGMRYQSFPPDFYVVSRFALEP